MVENLEFHHKENVLLDRERLSHTDVLRGRKHGLSLPFQLNFTLFHHFVYLLKDDK